MKSLELLRSGTVSSVMDLDEGGFGKIWGADRQRPEAWRHQLLVLTAGFLVHGLKNCKVDVFEPQQF